MIKSGKVAPDKSVHGQANEEQQIQRPAGVSFDLREGETLGLVGESGCGKSVTALSIMRLIPDPPGRIVGGQLVFNGVDLLQISDAEMRASTWRPLPGSRRSGTRFRAS